MRNLLLVVLLIILSASAFADSTTTCNNEISLEWGSNYYSNCMKIAALHQINSSVAVGLGYSKGSIAFWARTFWGVDPSENNVTVDIDLVNVIDLSIYYTRRCKGNVAFFRKLGMGISHYDAVLTLSQFVDDHYLSGDRKMGGFAVLCKSDIIEYRPRKNDRFAIALGAQARITQISSPLDVTLSAGYHYETLTLEEENMKHMLFILPEATLRFSYGF